MELKLQRVQYVAEADEARGAILHVTFSADVEDDDVFHTAEFLAVVVLNRDDDPMSFTLGEIESMARTCLRPFSSIEL